MKSKKISVIVLLILIGLIINLLTMFYLIGKMEGSSRLINDIGRIRGGIQRSVKEVFINVDIPQENLFTSNVDELLMNVMGELDESDIFSAELYQVIQNVSDTWNDLKQDMKTYSTGNQIELEEKILKGSEELWEMSDLAVTMAQEDLEKNIGYGNYLIYLLVFNLLLGVLLLFFIQKYVKNELEKFANIDFLTEVHNRKFLKQYLEIEIRKAERKKRELSLILLDIDDFKKINDTYGHSKGDQVLKKMAFLMKEQIRKSDLLARFGGEEFVIVLSETEKEGAYILAEKIRKAVEKVDFDCSKVTISLGIGYYAERDTKEILLEKADCAMYRAKTTGKNKTEIYES